MEGSELNYTVSEKEALAIIYALDKFEYYFYGNPFVIETDYKPLSFMKSNCEFNARLRQWQLKLSQFNYEIKYVPGDKNKIADVLSRLVP